MNFDNVYRVTTRLRCIEAESIDALACDLGMPLPAGYEKYLTTLGQGELCDYLRVWTPQQVSGGASEKGEGSRLRDIYVKGLENDRWQNCGLTTEDLANAVTFASSAEGDHFVCCPRFGSALFKLPRHGDTIKLMDEGFYGAVAISTERMEHDFPFFETWAGKSRWLRCFDVRPELGTAGFITEVKQRWGIEGFRQSRRVADGTMPNLFVIAIGGRFELDLMESDPTLPAGSFAVSMSHDIEREAEGSAFVELVQWPGRESWSGLSKR